MSAVLPRSRRHPHRGVADRRPSGCASGPAARTPSRPPAASRPITTAWTAPFRASSLAQVLLGIEAMEAKYGLRCANVFHAGDGNLHPLILFDANQPGEFERAEAFGADILELCVEVGGTITGEHGVGIEKINSMCVQFSPQERDAFFARQARLRSGRPAQPGQGDPDAARAAPSTARCTCGAGHCRSPNCRAFESRPMEQALQEFRERILRATAERQPLRIRGGGSKDWYGQRAATATSSTRAPIAASSTTSRPSW